MGTGTSLVPLLRALEDSGHAEVLQAYSSLSSDHKHKLAEALRKLEMPTQEVEGQSSQEGAFSRISSTATLEGVSPKPILRPASRPLSPAVEAKLKECFDEISKRSGMIDLSTYKQVMRKLQVPLDDDQMERVFESVDRNKDGKLSFDEYTKLVMLGM